ncbi:MAG TPA: lysophospholipid acyltransferase family protein [Phycisphaerae bacterium]|nr:lysophospholipid acyltransferase family protein [Phycisphaerae bacterium]
MKQKSPRQLPSPLRRPKPFDILRTAFIYTSLWLGVIVYLLLFGAFLLLAGCTFDRRRSLARKIARHIFTSVVRFHCWLERDPLRVDPPPFDSDSIGPCIVVANHASMMDSVLLMQLPPGIGDGRVWAKGWPFKVPLLGSLMRLSGHMFVEDFNILPNAREFLADGTSLLVFPESSRTRTGHVGRFREGAFLLAARTGCPIVPVALHGSFECFPAGQPWIFGPRLRVQPLGVLYADPTDARSHVALRRRAREMIVAALGESAAKENLAATAA